MKPLAEMNLVDDFLAHSLASHKTYGEEASRFILECILQRRVRHLTVVTQKTWYGEDPQGHGVRLDLYLDEEDGEIFDMEPDSNGGAGDVAARRILALLEFGCELSVIAPEAVPRVENLAGEGRLVWEKSPYRPGMVKEAALVLAATDSRTVNEEIWRECRELKIPVNVSSDRRLCDFYFPGIIRRENLVMGFTSGGQDHQKIREIREKTERIFEQY